MGKNGNQNDIGGEKMHYVMKNTMQYQTSKAVWIKYQTIAVRQYIKYLFGELVNFMNVLLIQIYCLCKISLKTPIHIYYIAASNSSSIVSGSSFNSHHLQEKNYITYQMFSSKALHMFQTYSFSFLYLTYCHILSQIR